MRTAGQVPRFQRSIAVLLLWVFGAAGGEELRLIRSMRLGGPGEDDLQAGAIAADGTLYVTGNAATALAPPGAVLARTPGSSLESAYGHAFVARLTPDGERVTHLHTFPQGRAFLTSIAVQADAVYAGGYLLPEGVAPLIRTPRLTRRQGVHGEYGGRPCVMRLEADLSRVTATRIFEGGHFVWSVPENLREFRWQPTDIALLPDGDVVVAIESGLGARYFYSLDRVARLSPDLRELRWEVQVLHPAVHPPGKVSKYWPEFENWSFPAFGQPRITRLRTSEDGRIAVAGWAPTKTSREPWWCPFLIVLDKTGKEQGRAYTFDPMSGGGDRLNGEVSDSAILSVAFDRDGGLLFSGGSDGGNTILARDPRDFAQPASALRGSGPMVRAGRRLFYGVTGRLHADGSLAAGSRLHSLADPRSGSEPQWVEDLAPLSRGSVLAAGRHGAGFRASGTSWFETPALPATSPGGRSRTSGMLCVFDRDFNTLWSTSLPGIDPVFICVREGRALAVGVAWADTAAGAPAGPAHEGGSDGWLLILEEALRVTP